MSVKDTAGDHEHCERRRHRRRVLWSISLFIVVVLLVVFLVWLILRPTKPSFYLQDARVLNLNLSQPNFLSTTIQVTISSRNPNEHVGVFYDRLNIYAVYKSQQITPAVELPPFYQGHKDVDVWSPYLSGFFVPIAPYLCTNLLLDEAGGTIFLDVKIDGRVRWKVGDWTSDRYHIYVDCPAFLSFDGSSGGGTGDAPIIRFQQLSACSVEV
ncbi:Protein NDR1 [Apostasia shenzhenica]|uniref:Protein NDR1 n=1 Tax=Apostasia shenzhenica TaxID=1088818 RepID=A0A2I0BC53_9ASPA|nr:Protein NDR1 [Apostasia shenzhenica]